MTASLDGASAAGTQHGVVARIIRDSVTRGQDRLTTFEVRMHRFVLAEFNTHRVFSRNSASSRAIPVAKQLERVITDPAVPVVWAAEQKGMSGGDEIEDVVGAYLDWEGARDAAVRFAKSLAEKGVHKSITNRLLEPFMWHIVIVTASSYKNFFGLRVNPGAQPEIRTAATLMQRLFDNSAPTLVQDGQWHLPFMSDEEVDSLGEVLDAVKVSAARCARVSYLTHDGDRNMEKDIELYDKLTSAWPMHASPLEHVATPYVHNSHMVDVRSRFSRAEMVLRLPRYGNFHGWHQHRFDVEAEKKYQAFA